MLKLFVEFEDLAYEKSKEFCLSVDCTKKLNKYKKILKL